MTRASFLQRQHAIDYWFQLSSKHALHDIEKFPVAAHRRSDYLELPKENLTQVGLRCKTCRGATRQHAAAATRRAKASNPGIGADIVDDNIHASFVGQLANLLIELVGLVVDEEIGAELACPLEFGVAAG